MQQHYPVVIVGGGPVGIGLAVELGLRGIRTAVIERRTGMHNVPKGQNLMGRTIEHFARWGIADALRAARIMPPEIESNGIVAYGTLMSPYWFATKGREIVKPYYAEPNDRLPQYLMETVLRRRLDELGTADTFYGWAAHSVVQDATGVHVGIAEDGSTERRTLEADYVVGCDGGHSVVREAIGIARGGKDFDQPMVLTVFRSRAFHEGLSRFPVRSTYRVMDPALNGYWQFFGRIDVGEGFFFHAPVPPGTNRDNFDFHGMIEKVAGFTFPAEFDHVGFWDLRVAVAERYQVGRAFIAGDAAHSHPPYGGYGVNNGLEDAVNLGWKLAATIEGWGGPALLPSYSEERRAIFKETADDFIAERIAMEGRFLGAYSPDRDKAAFERAWVDLENDVGNRVQTYAPHYSGSPVVCGPAGAVSSAHGRHTFEARAGHHLSPQRLSDGRRVFDALGKGYTLLAFDADDAAVKAFETTARAHRVPLTIVRDTATAGREAYAARLILVRPDQYVAWTGDTAPPDTAVVLRRASGHQSAA